MKFTLPNPVFRPSFKIAHRDKLFFIGSCFAEGISQYFEDRKFVLNKNPYGILYNPVSIANCIEQIITGKDIATKNFYEKDGLFSSWDHHSTLSERSEATLEEKLAGLNKQSKIHLSESDVIFVTLGTAWVYWHKELGKVVANNLKAPLDLFERRLLEITTITDSLQQIITHIKSLNNDARIVLTVSPVRHSKQGLIENNRSKARLLEAVHQLCDLDQDLIYFPSYELFIDVLRDYRFSKKDLVHPNELATDYIWQFIEDNFIYEKDIPLLEELHKLQLALNHKIRNRSGADAQGFIASQLEKIAQLSQNYPYLDLKEVHDYFKAL